MSKTSITPKQVQHLAKLACLSLTGSQLSKFATEIPQILEHVKTIQTLDLKDFPPTNQVTGKTNELRADQITPSLTQKQALQAAKTHRGFFVVSRLIDHES